MEKSHSEREGSFTGSSVRDLMNRVCDHRILTAEEETALAKRIERGDLEAKETLISSNYRLVADVAFRSKRLWNRGLDIDDLFMEGCTGLIRASEKFDYRRGYKFSTYATRWIEHDMQRAVENTAHPIRIPVHRHEKLSSLVTARERYREKFEVEPTFDELALEVGIEAVEVQSLLEADYETTPLNKEIRNEKGEIVELGSLIPDSRGQSVEEMAIEQADRDKVRSLTSSVLDSNELEVLVKRFGLDSQPALTATELSASSGVSYRIVRELEQQSLDKLRTHLAGFSTEQGADLHIEEDPSVLEELSPNTREVYEWLVDRAYEQGKITPIPAREYTREAHNKKGIDTSSRMKKVRVELAESGLVTLSKDNQQWVFELRPVEPKLAA